MKKNTLARLAITALMLAAIACPLLAQAPPPPPPGGGPGGRMGPDPVVVLKDVLGLTEEQVTSLNALLEARKQSSEPIMIQLKETEEALRQLLQSSDPDTAKIEELKALIATLRRQLEQINEVCRSGFNSMLTERQQALVADVLAVEKKVMAAHSMRGMGLVAPPSTTESGSARENFHQCPKRGN